MTHKKKSLKMIGGYQLGIRMAYEPKEVCVFYDTLRKICTRRNKNKMKKPMKCKLENQEECPYSNLNKLRRKKWQS